MQSPSFRLISVLYVFVDIAVLVSQTLYSSVWERENSGKTFMFLNESFQLVKEPIRPSSICKKTL